MVFSVQRFSGFETQLMALLGFLMFAHASFLVTASPPRLEEWSPVLLLAYSALFLFNHAWLTGPGSPVLQELTAGTIALTVLLAGSGAVLLRVHG
ncbi:MAG: hypothetical protein SVQ76_02705 [Candidatus Nanohaloarchaea archaeon]|nr:hypothetical protein [Candidatus Nanohaloarchaea archaeon]